MSALLPPGESAPEIVSVQIVSRKTWWSRHWKWALPMSLLGGTTFLVAAIALLIFGIAAASKSSEPYQEGLLAAQQDQRVITALGEPLKDGFMPSGSIEISGERGQAQLSVPLQGSRGRGKLHIEAVLYAGQWQYTTLLVSPENGEPIDLTEAAE